jgi:hypothetical protein
MRRKIYLITAVAIMAVLLLPQGASAKPANVCPPGFDIGAVDLAEAIALPNTQLALADGFATLEGAIAGFEALDRNDDGLVCFGSFPSNASPSSLLQYFYNGADNNASVPGG